MVTSMSKDLYCEFFGFRERPFTLLPDPDFLFWSTSHSRAFSVLEYGLVTCAPITVITGEVGTGKTTLLHKLLKEIDDQTTVALISNAQGGRGDLLRWVLGALDIASDPGADYVALFHQVQAFLLEEYAAGRHVVAIIDEAQNLTPDVLEELRMLTNINSGKDTLLQLLLIGQPELREMISRPELRQFAQRVTATFHIKPMDIGTTFEYVRYRLKCVDGSGHEFDDEAIALIHQISGGIPRIVNKICDIALVYAASDGVPVIGAGIVDEIRRDELLIGEDPDPLVLTNRIYTVSDKAAQ